jgi:hypothetical protein
MLNPPRAVDHLPTLEHNGTEILPIIHYGFSSPKKGPQPAPRTLYGAKDGNGERHWRSTLEEIEKLIDCNFQNADKEEQA